MALWQEESFCKTRMLIPTPTHTSSEIARLFSGSPLWSTGTSLEAQGDSQAG